MREIIFRAWDKQEEKYWTDLLNEIGDNDIYDNNVSMWAVGYMMEHGDDSRFIFEQYTGCYEKKSGKRLFDGDNFSVETMEDDGRKSLAYFTVCWDNDGLCWKAKSFAGSMLDEFLADIVDDSLVVIGNIHDKEQLDGQEH